MYNREEVEADCRVVKALKSELRLVPVPKHVEQQTFPGPLPLIFFLIVWVQE